MKRESISKKTRFEVFKRDSFTCQYCGAKAPDVILEVDHIKPVASEGDGTVLNLITSCKACNAGKGARELSDQTVLARKRLQLADLQERREQLDMVMEWQQGLTKLDAEKIDQVAEFWSGLVSPFSLNDSGRKSLKTLLRRFGLQDVMEAIRVSVDTYIEHKEGQPTHESVELAWSKVGGICRVAKLSQEIPDLKELYYIRGILRNRFHYCNDVEALKLLKSASKLGATIDSLRTFSEESHNWSSWRAGMEEFIDKNSQNDNS